jgi:hypothetical protein
MTTPDRESGSQIRELKQQVVGQTVEQQARQTGSRLASVIRENPIPVAAIGLGVTAGRVKEVAGQAAREVTEQATESAGRVSEATKESIGREF